MSTFKFYKTGDEWFVDLPQYLAQGGNHADLQMVEGADEMLELMSKGEDVVFLNISEDRYEPADVLTLTGIAEPVKGGGYYLMRAFEGKEINLRIWLCKVTEFVFGKMPEAIFINRS